MTLEELKEKLQHADVIDHDGYFTRITNINDNGVETFDGEYDCNYTFDELLGHSVTLYKLVAL